jgi:hypothetical protein
MHRMPKPLLRAGFITGDGERYARLAFAKDKPFVAQLSRW